jgi:hypothetical protein
MPKVKISEYSATANSNTDVASINIDEGCAPSGINNAIRAIMGHLKDFQSGTSNDPFTVGSSGSLTLSYGTANGVAYLNGSKVLTTGSALVFDGTSLGVGTSSPVLTAAGRGNVTINGSSTAIIALAVGGSAKGWVFHDNTNMEINAGSAGALSLLTGGVNRLFIDASGNSKFGGNISVGGVTVTTSGTGITFPATQNASSDANTLDDYEEGTFTPTDGSGAGLSITFNNAKYTKIGRLVYISISTIVYPATANTAAASIAGLPFTNSAADAALSALVSASAFANRGLVIATNSFIFLYPTASASQALNSQLSGTTIYGLSAVYQV